MLILHIGNFHILDRRGMHALSNIKHLVSRGLEAHGHYVVEFSDRDIARHLAPFRLGKNWGRKRMFRALIDVTRTYKPDMIWIGMGDLLSREVLAGLKRLCPSAPIILYNTDQRTSPFPHIVEKAAEIDWLFLTGGGEILRTYHRHGIRNAAFLPNMVDTSLGATEDPAWESNILFTGSEHGEPDRAALIRHLIAHTDIKVYRAFGQRTIMGRDYLQAVGNTKIGIDISAYPNVSKYLSDRVVHYLGCGTFALTRSVPSIETLFVPGKEIEVFTDKDECLDKIRYYLAYDGERQRIAKSGFEAVRLRFTPAQVVGDMLATIDGKVPERSWTEIYGPQ